MRILVIGPHGYVGSALVEHLLSSGHEVVELVRRHRGSNALGLEQRIADLAEPESLRSAVTTDIDAVVHAATPSGDLATDSAAIAALMDPLRGTGRAFVYTSGVWVLGPAGPTTADELTPTNPIPIVAYRPEIEKQVVAAAEDGVRSMVLRPGIVHGRNGGIPALLVDLARKRGVPTVVGDVPARWPMVHVDDLADLYVLALEKAPAGTVWHGVSEAAVPVRDLAAAAGHVVGAVGAPQVWPLREAQVELGEAFASALALDQSVSGDRALSELGWQPGRPIAVEDLREGSYR